MQEQNEDDGCPRRALRWMLLLVLSVLGISACARQATVLPAPTITGVSPEAASPLAGTSLTISGANFFQASSGRFSGVLSVTVCGLPLQDVTVSGSTRRIILPGGASASIVQGTSLTGTLPAGQPDGSGAVIVRLPDGQSASLTGAFDCQQAPRITSFTAVPETVEVGVPVVLSWDIANPAGSSLTCSLDPGTGAAAAVACAAGSSQHSYDTAGSFTATLTVSGPGFEPVEAAASVSVSQSAPDAVDDSFSAALDTALEVPAPGVLANDLPAGATPSVGGTSDAGGTVTLAADGSFRYVPAAGFTGTDTFIYTLSNGAGTDTATVTITVGMAPEANDDLFATTLDVPLTVSAPGLLANDALNGARLSHDTLSEHGGTVTAAADGSFTYAPAAGFTGADGFSYTLTNGVGSATARVTISVSHLPQALDDHFATGTGVPLSVAAPGVLGNDAGSPAPVVTSMTGSSAQGGTYGLLADGAVTYTPPAGFVGQDSFTYSITNPAGTATATVFVTVGEPPAAVPDDLWSVKDNELVIPLNALLVNDSVNGAQLSLVSGASSSGGSVMLTAAEVLYTAPAGFTGTDSFNYRLTNPLGSSEAVVTVSVSERAVAADDSYATAVGQLLQVDAAAGVLANDTGVPAPAVQATSSTGTGGTFTVSEDGSFSFSPAAGFTGYASFDYTIGNVAGISTATVTIQVGQPAQAVADTVADVLGNTWRSYGTGDLLANDTGDLLVLDSVATASTAGGALQLSGDQLTYHPPAGFTGTDTFTYTVRNGFGTSSATVSVDVEGIIWFLDAAATSAGTGTIAAPFMSLSSLPSLTAGAVVFFYSGSYPGGITLNDGVRLIGQAATGELPALAGVTWNSSATVPTLTGPTGADASVALGSIGLVLASGNSIHGLSISGSASASPLLSGAGFGQFTVSDTSLYAMDRPALQLSDGSVAAQFLWVGSEFSHAPVTLTDLEGTINVADGRIVSDASPTSRCIDVRGNTAGSLQLHLSSLELEACRTGVDVVMQGSAEARLYLQDLDVQVSHGSINLYGRDEARIRLSVSESDLTTTEAQSASVGVWAVSEDAASTMVQISNSSIQGGDFGVRAVAREGSRAVTELTLLNSTINLIGNWPYAGLAADSGNGSADEAASLCLNASGNSFTSGTGAAADIVIDQYAGNLLWVAGYTGGAQNGSQLENFLSGSNNDATVIATGNLDVAGGAQACRVPAPFGGN